MTKDMIVEASQILKSAQMEYSSLSSERTTSNNETNSNNAIRSKDLSRIGVHGHRPSYFAIERMEKQELIAGQRKKAIHARRKKSEPISKPVSQP